MAGDPPLELTRVSFVRDGRSIIDDVSLTVRAGENWLVLGANGSGKTTLLRIAAMYEHPSSGRVRVLGEELGRTDVRRLRQRVGYASAALTAEFRRELTASEVVVTAKHAALEPWWHRYDAVDRRRARDCLDRMGVGRLHDRALGTLSSGEQQRVFLARTLMNDPGVVLLDEPFARLDLGGREQLVHALSDMADDDAAPPFVLVSHHVEEVPHGMTHAMMLLDGRVLAAGPIDAVLTAERLGQCFGLELELERLPGGRFSARANR